MDRKVWIYGHADKSKLGFEKPDDLREYIRNDIFAKENGRYRFTQEKNANIIVLSRDGKAYGHFEIERKEKPNDADRKAYPPVKCVYLVLKSSLYNEPVRLSRLSITGIQFGYQLSEEKFQQLQQYAEGVTECHNILALPHSEVELERVLREVKQRLGQGDFRQALIEAYKGKCQVTDCNAVDALEAAHIIPHSNVASNDPSNGLLLRADIHTLFDRDLLGVNPDSLVVAVKEKLSGTCYERLEGKTLSISDNPAVRPSKESLQGRWKKFHLKD